MEHPVDSDLAKDNAVTQKTKNTRKSRKPKDITGLRKGKLVAVRCLGIKYYGNYVWEWKCECGNTIGKTLPQLLHSTSCGCSGRRRRGRKPSRNREMLLEANKQKPPEPKMPSMPRFIIHKKADKVL